ncbi:MAG: hypothetical protein MOB07_31515 [Acidobacteria bacterium]|nr:hypothetical protein [Acidobacteriota bacterium]
MNNEKSANGASPLSQFVNDRLADLQVRPSRFCKQIGMDAGLMSKIQLSKVSNLNLESALKLSVGFGVPPSEIFKLLGRDDWRALFNSAWLAEQQRLE